MSFVIVDTDILIDAGRAISTALDCLRRLEQQSTLAVSAATQMELLVGCRNKAELRELAKFLQRFQVLKISADISDEAVGLLQRYRLQRFQSRVQEPLADARGTATATVRERLHTQMKNAVSHGLLISDALIAATALQHNEPFITKSQRDYRFIAKLKLLPYP